MSQDPLGTIVEQLAEAEDFEAAARRLCDWARSLTGCEASLLRLWCEGDEAGGWLPALLCQGVDARFLQDESLLGEGECVCGRVCGGHPLPDLPLFTAGGAFVCDSAQSLYGNPALEELGARGRCLSEGFESIAIIPLGGADHPIGCLHLADRRQGVFHRHVDTLVFVCEKAGLVLGSYQPADRDRLLVKAIEGALTPELPRLDGVEAAVRFVSASKAANVGGDFYDILPIDDGGITVFVGDYVGKGVAVAGEAARLRQSISLLAGRISDLDALVSHVNRLALNVCSDGRFATIAVCQYRPGLPLRSAIAGHPPPAVLRGPAEAAELPLPRNAPVGVFDDYVFASGSCHWNHDDTLLLYTDGITESRRDGRLFGLEGMASLWPGAEECGLGQYVETVCDAAHRFHDESLPPDDRLLLAVRFRPNR